ncbi:MAG: DUF354 domain-containing protein [Crenarchaeota archaeon]|nr:DUF354 domain-containing protein [Thermoproteota archaeon]
MLIWFDALTPKQARIGAILFLEGCKRGIGVLITGREYSYIEETLRPYSVPFIKVSEYGESLKEKLLKYAERIRYLTNLLPEFDVAVGFPSPDMHRVAFGLGRPIITLTDTVHADKVHRLCLPLSSLIVVPDVIPMEEILKYVVRGEEWKVVRFHGVFEIMWVRRHTPCREVLDRLGLEPEHYVIVRPEESRAHYYEYGDKLDILCTIIDRIVKKGLKVVFLPRYRFQEEHIKRKLYDNENIVIPRGIPLNMLDLYSYARLVITGGLSMATEAALMGVPSVSYFPSRTYIEDLLKSIDAPLIKVSSIVELCSMIDDLLELPRARPRVEELEDPTDLILNKAQELSRG